MKSSMVTHDPYRTRLDIRQATTRTGYELLFARPDSACLRVVDIPCSQEPHGQ